MFYEQKIGCSYEQKIGCSYEQKIPLIPRCQGLAVGGCCEAAADGIRPWTPWIWGILNFRSNKVLFLRNLQILLEQSGMRKLVLQLKQPHRVSAQNKVQIILG